jgi:DNA excision repair protein ERCC-4
MIDSSIVDGYTSCSQLQNDVVHALKYYANSVILSEKENDWYADCDPSDPDPYYPYCGGPGVRCRGRSKDDRVEVLYAAAASSADSSVATPEDSFDTNVQVKGVDEADVVKSERASERIIIGYNTYLLTKNFLPSSDPIICWAKFLPSITLHYYSTHSSHYSTLKP